MYQSHPTLMISLAAARVDELQRAAAERRLQLSAHPRTRPPRREMDRHTVAGSPRWVSRLFGAARRSELRGAARG
jgi:hypothetical protein